MTWILHYSTQTIILCSLEENIKLIRVRTQFLAHLK